MCRDLSAVVRVAETTALELFSCSEFRAEERLHGRAAELQSCRDAETRDTEELKKESMYIRYRAELSRQWQQYVGTEELRYYICT